MNVVKHTIEHVVLGFPISTTSTGSGLTEVIHDNSLSGKGTIIDPLIVLYPTSTGQMKVSSTDTNYDYLENKIVSSTGIFIRTSTGTNGDVVVIGSTSSPSPGGSKPDFIIDIPAGSWNYPLVNPAPLDNDIGIYGNLYSHLFDDVVTNYVLNIDQTIEMPGDIDTSKSVTFEATGYAYTSDATNVNVKLRLTYSLESVNRLWDIEYITMINDSNDIATSTTQNELVSGSWTNTLASLGWTASKQVRINLKRIASSANDLNGYFRLINFRISIPRS